jgi:pimeloyl-ACP methyl ester carboxylesterase
MQHLSRSTQNDEQRIRDWLDILEMSPPDKSIRDAQRGFDIDTGDRLQEYRKIKSPCLVIGFADDLIVPAVLAREVAEHIPSCRYEEIADCGHYGYLEEPAAVNSAIINFFRD